MANSFGSHSLKWFQKSVTRAVGALELWVRKVAEDTGMFNQDETLVPGPSLLGLLGYNGFTYTGSLRC